MEQSRVDRKLIAIHAADAKGYTSRVIASEWAILNIHREVFDTLAALDRYD